MLAIFEANLARLKDLLRDAIALLPARRARRGCQAAPAGGALDGLTLPFELP